MFVTHTDSSSCLGHTRKLEKSDVNHGKNVNANDHSPLAAMSYTVLRFILSNDTHLIPKCSLYEASLLLFLAAFVKHAMCN